MRKAKVLEDKVGEHLYIFGVQKNFFNKTWKAENKKEKTDFKNYEN